MKRQAQNTFANGMIKDLAPISTPKDILTDCLNGTIITYNGNEFVLQNDMGNCQVDLAKLSPGFIPLGMKEYGGIVYVASLNPETGVCEIGSFPSPQEDFSTTDYGEIGPANFLDTDFTVDTGDDSVKEHTVKNLKLFEPELMTLHPGDLYVVLYTIHPVTGTPGNEIIDETSYENFISEDPSNRKLFRLVFSKINDNNNLIPLDPLEIKVIPYKVDVSGDYVYFKEPSQAVITVGLEVEQLDMFDAEVVDSSLNTNSDKKVTVAAIGVGNSLANFQGVRVEVTSPATQTFYLDKQGTNKKVQAVIDGLAANDSFQCSVTPYSPYCLYPQLTKNFNLIMGQYLSGGSGVNNLFLYYVDTDSIKVQFDYRFQGNSPDGIYLYVEFYDPWSDYSIIKAVDNPTYYGLNSITLELVDEPRIDLFNSTTVGGTPASKLITNSDTLYEKTLLNSTNLIRTDQFLRRNHFYIVRISGVDRIYDQTTQQFTYQHYDFYKGLYTTTMFNSVYTNQLAMSVTDPGYVSDFNSLNFDLSKIGYDSTISKAYDNTQVPVVQNYPNTQVTDPSTGVVSTQYPLMTNNDYYAVLSSAWTGSSTYRAETTFETDDEYNLQLKIVGEDQVFGNFKENLLSASFPTLLASNASGTGIKPTIVEAVVPGAPVTNTVANWVITSLGGGSYKIDLSLKTARSVEAPVKLDTTNTHGYIYKLVSIAASFHYATSGSPIDGQNALGLGGYQSYGPSTGNAYIKWLDPSGSLQTYDLGHAVGPNGNEVYSVLNQYSKKWSAVWGGAELRANFLHWQGAPGDYASTSVVGPKSHMVYWRNESDGSYCPSRIIDISLALDFFNKVKVASNVLTNLYLYYPDSSSMTSNGQLSTTAKFTGASITTTLSPDIVLGNPVKTYISTFRFRALNEVIDFNPTDINAYIQTRLSDSVILDGKDTIRDGFIPYISAPQTTSFPMTFDDINITQSASSAMFTAMQEGSVQGPQDSAFVVPGNVKPHGTLTLEDGDTQYASYLANFVAGGWTSGVEIDPNTVYIKINHSSGVWIGGWAANGHDNWGTGPYLYQDIQIT